MNMFEEAKALRCVIESRKMTQKELAKSLGMSASYVANKLRLLSLDEVSQKTIIEAGISERHARALLRINDDAVRAEALARILNEKMSVERAEAMICTLTDRQAPALIRAEDPACGVTRFLDSIKSSCEALASLGVDVERKIRYNHKKLCIYITVDEE